MFTIRYALKVLDLNSPPSLHNMPFFLDECLLGEKRVNSARDSN
jgi:hypothetical protein